MLEIKDLSYRYKEQEILKNVSYIFETGKIYAIVGESGVGKSTFLSLISGLEFLQQGEIYYKDKKITNYPEYRRSISYIFQAFNLISYLSAVDNIKIALEIHRKKVSLPAINYTLKELGIQEKNTLKKCTELSGGQQQRVAIARAIALGANLVIADEPTGNLDKRNAKQVMSLFKKLSNEGKCIIVVTHDRTLAAEADVVLTLEDGALVAAT